MAEPMSNERLEQLRRRIAVGDETIYASGAAALIAEVDRLRSTLAQMTLWRDNALECLAATQYELGLWKGRAALTREGDADG